MSIAITLLVASLVAGQLLRLPLPGQGGGLLVSDVATVLVVCVALANAAKHRFQNTKRLVFVFCLLCFFIVWSLFTLILHFPELGRANFLVASLYWVRLSATLLLVPALLFLLESPKLHLFTRRLFVITALALAFLGFIQVAIFPNLTIPGWDPHQGRLVSTWLDPNFIGGFFALVLPIMTAKVFLPLTKGEYPEPSVVQGVGVVVALLALLFTQSRSSFIALGLAAVSTIPIWFLALRSRPHQVRLATLGVGLSLFIALIIFPILLFPERVSGLLRVDDTAALRLVSLKSALALASTHPVFGVGYNAYQFAAREAGFLSDFTIHSRAGADSSLVTLAAATGFVGVVLFFLPWLVIAWHLFHRAVAGHVPSAAAVTSLTVLFIHSQFVNSFLYSHLLITLTVIVALTLTHD